MSLNPPKAFKVAAAEVPLPRANRRKKVIGWLTLAESAAANFGISHSKFFSQTNGTIAPNFSSHWDKYQLGSAPQMNGKQEKKMQKHCRLLNQRKYTKRKWAPAFIRDINIKFFVRSIRDNNSVPLSNGNNEMIISGSELRNTASPKDFAQFQRPADHVTRFSKVKMATVYSELCFFQKIKVLRFEKQTN